MPMFVRIAGFVLIGLLVYAGGWSGGFYFDDMHTIVTNDAICNISDFNGMFNIGYHSLSRFIGYFSFAVNYWIGGIDPYWYHGFNIILHIVCGLVVWWLAVVVIKATKSGYGNNYVIDIGMLAGLLFVVHPLNSQAANYITQRFMILATIFYLLSMISYIYGRSGVVRRSNVWFYCTSCLFGLLSILSKEIGFTLPIGLLLCDLVISRSEFPKTKNVNYYIPMFSMFLFLLFLLNHNVHELFSPVLSDYENDGLITWWMYGLTQIRVVVQYIKLAVFPHGLTIDHLMPVTKDLHDISVWMNFAFIAAITATAWLKRKSYPVVSFGVLLFFAGMLADSSIKPLRNVMFEHRTYLAMAGFSTAVVYSVFKSMKSYAVPVLAVLIFVLSVATTYRCEVWSSADRLWGDAVKKSPMKSRPYNNLGVAHMIMGRYDLAASDFKTAHNLNPDDAGISNNYKTALSVLKHINLNKD